MPRQRFRPTFSKAGQESVQDQGCRLKQKTRHVNRTLECDAVIQSRPWNFMHMKEWTMVFDTYANSVILDMDSEFKYSTRDSVLTLQSTPWDWSPRPRTKMRTGIRTLNSWKNNVLHCDHNVYTKTISWETTAQDCCLWKNISFFKGNTFDFDEKLT